MDKYGSCDLFFTLLSKLNHKLSIFPSRGQQMPIRCRIHIYGNARVSLLIASVLRRNNVFTNNKFFNENAGSLAST